MLVIGSGVALIACAVAEPVGTYPSYGYYGAPYGSYYYPPSYYPPYATYGAFGYGYGSRWGGSSWHRPWHDGARFRSFDHSHRMSPPSSHGRSAAPPPSQGGAQSGAGSHRGFLGNVLRQRQQ